MINNKLTLKWTKLINISDLIYHDRDERGVYLWGFYIDNNFIPYYLGIANNIIFRIHQHIKSIIGGEYIVFHCDSLANFKDYKDQEVNVNKTNGKIYLPDWPYEYKKFIDNRKDLQKHIDFMVDSFTFSFATVDKKVITSNDLKEIEQICINQIGKENLVNKRAGKSNRFIINNIGDKIVTDKFKASNR